MTTAAQPLQAIAGFAALLRDHGLKVGIAEQQAMVQAALGLPLSQSRRLDAAWRAIACQDTRQWKLWPDLFEAYWHPNRVKGTVRSSGATRPSRDMRQLVADLQQQLAGEPAHRPGRGSDTSLATEGIGHDEGDPGLQRAQGGATRVEALHDRSLSQWLPQDLAQLQLLADQIAQRLRRRLTRRWINQRQGRRLDLRRTLRSSLATGGVPVQPAWRKPRRERPRLFILVDVSRSMETHAQLFLRIARAFVGAAQARVFVFHTRLVEITPLLQRDSAAVQEKVNAVTAGFGGGTRIATSLEDFRCVHARAQLRGGARLWMFSDGYDADEPHRLGEELRHLSRRGLRIQWFHPGERRPTSAALQGCESLVSSWWRLNSLRDLEALSLEIA